MVGLPRWDICSDWHLVNRIFVYPLCSYQPAYSKKYDSSSRRDFEQQYAISPADIARCWPLRWYRFCWNWCRCTCRSATSCHCAPFWRCRKLSKIFIGRQMIRYRAAVKKWMQVVPSKMGLASRICCSIHECLPLMAARYCKISLVLSVLPAPDSPLR